MLGMGGTLSAEVSFELDASDLDSNMPDELCIILLNNKTDMLSFVGQEGPPLSPRRLLFHMIVKKPSITSTSSTDLDASV